MDRLRWREIRARFDELVELAPPERSRRLVALASTDAGLHRVVVSLLAADAAAGERLRQFESVLLPPLQSPPRETSSFPVDVLGLTGRTISHFRVLGPLGSGGMSMVYRAEDERLERNVALKFLLPQFRLERRAKERFLLEARSAGALDHPNICTIYDVGESEDGWLFLAMPLYTGALLSERLARMGPLAIDEAVKIGRQIASGLTCAHAAGIVHRDLKPGNLMLLADGTLKILDFGLAKATDSSLTDPGHRPGTLAYMAPEQIRGEAVDGRTDLWAVGTIMYEMLTGKRPFGSDHSLSMAYAITHDEPLAPASFRPDIPPDLNQLILRLLQKEPANRYFNAGELTEALTVNAAPSAPAPFPSVTEGRSRRRIGVGALGAGLTVISVVAITAISALLIGRPGIWNAGLTPPSENQTAVRGTTSARAHDFYLRGREYQLRGDHLESQRMAEQLYRTAVELDPGFALAHARLAYTHGWFFFFGHDTSSGRMEQMRAAAETALRLDPELPEAHLAMGYYWYTGPRDYRKALDEFELARRAAPGDAEVHAAIAYVHRRQGRWESAVQELERAVELNPRYPKITKDLAVAYLQLRRYPRAVSAWDRVLALEPDNYNALLLRAEVFLGWQGTSDSLAAALRRIPTSWDPGGDRTLAAATLAQLEQRPRQVLDALDAMRRDAVDQRDYLRIANLLMMRAQAHLELGDTAGARGHYIQARSTLEEGAAYYADDRAVRASLAVVLARLGDRQLAIQEARRARDEAHAEAAEGHRYLTSAAESYAWAGESDAALEVLAQVIGSPGQLTVHHLRLESRWDPLRQHPGFQQLLGTGTGAVGDGAGAGSGL